jgi:hypothetical protein
MSLQKSLNFVRGWPNPHIHEHVGKPATGVVPLEGAIAHRDVNGKWVLGVSAAGQLAYVLWNGAAGDGDQGVDFDKTKSSQQVNWGGVQGVGHDNPIEYTTTRYSGTPAFGDSLYADVDGILKVAVQADGTVVTASKIIVAQVTKAPAAQPNGVTAVQIIPDNSRRTS